MINFKKGYFKNQNPVIKDWDKPTIREFKGHKVLGRRTAGFGNIFSYAGKTYEGRPWSSNHLIFRIKTLTEHMLLRDYDMNVDFSFCLCGYYGTDGKGIPHHSDTVPTLDDLVVSISFGAPRVFTWRHYQNEIKQKTDTSEIETKIENFLVKEDTYILEHGDVLIFDGHSQMKSTHAVPDMVEAGERINLTFRTGI
tara:strand:- start:632 stop:1219 length:588 start_codon:yes stop_codon:yes gene_type:complete